MVKLLLKQMIKDKSYKKWDLGFQKPFQSDG